MITADQALERRYHIGSSDIAAILGIDPYKTAADVYWQKVGNIPVDEDRSDVNDACNAGNFLEGPIKDWAESRLGLIERDVYVEAEDGILAANLDGHLIGRPEIVEAKTCNVVGYSPERDQFGEEGTDQVPGRVLLQVQHQFYCAGPEYRVCHVPVLIGGRGFVLFRVERNDYLVNTVVERAMAFWNNHVIPRIPPTDSLASIDTLKLIERAPAEEVRVSDGLVEAYLTANAIKLETEKVAEAAKTELLNALGDAEIGVSSLGTVTYKMQHRKSYTVEASDYRVLRVKKL